MPGYTPDFQYPHDEVLLKKVYSKNEYNDLLYLHLSKEGLFNEETKQLLLLLLGDHKI
jgi:hypothetical protein